MMGTGEATDAVSRRRPRWHTQPTVHRAPQRSKSVPTTGGHQCTSWLGLTVWLLLAHSLVIWEWIRDHGDERDEEAARVRARAEMGSLKRGSVDLTRHTLIVKSLHVCWRGTQPSNHEQGRSASAVNKLGRGTRVEVVDLLGAVSSHVQDAPLYREFVEVYRYTRIVDANDGDIRHLTTKPGSNMIWHPSLLQTLTIP
ncbi:hypothetical protein B0T09DRAFT_372005 [Sordaria sp. MPI-SDFR-AT-0083]|nr:hypothetical protein B0T09DRAFT_372005 [Sordaria sp. MPI-SDFR-AT-0083]